MPTRSGRGLLKDVTPSATPASVPPAEPVIDDNVEAGLSAYELQRLANIRANEEVLKQLNLLPLSSQGLGVRSARAAPSQRGIGATKKRAASPAVATRESNRTRGKAAEYTGIRVEHSDGRVELSSGELVMPKTGKDMQAEAEVDPSQPLAFRHLNKTDEEEELEDDESGGGAAVTESREPFERDVALLRSSQMAATRAAARLQASEGASRQRAPLSVPHWPRRPRRPRRRRRSRRVTSTTRWW